MLIKEPAKFYFSKFDILCVVALFCLLVLSSGCRSVNKLKTIDTTKSDSTAITKTETNIITTEKIDTTITAPKDSITATFNVNNLLHGDTNEVNTGTISVKEWIDPHTHKLTIKVVTKPLGTHVFIDKKIISNTNQVSKIEVKKSEKKTSNTVVKSGTGSVKTGIIIGVSISFLILLILLYFIFRKKLRVIFPFLP